MRSEGFQLFALLAVLLSEGMGFTLRHPWEHRPLVSKQAKELQALQNSCKGTKTYRKYGMNSYGFGSGLQSLSKAMCNAHDRNLPLHVERSDWVWNDVKFCQETGNYTNPLECYFGTGIAASSCNMALLSKQDSQYWVRYKCPKYLIDDGDMLEVFKFEGYFYEFLFQHVNPEIVRLTEMAAQDIFGGDKSPDNMITIHIRWGDKEKEMGGLLPIESYINAALTLIIKHKLMGEISIFLSTESPKASKMFRKHPFVVKNKWRVYEYHKSISKQEGITHASFANNGPLGLQCIISILLSMESRFFVLTSASNWSTILAGLMNGIVAPDCNQCADWIDLKFNRLFKPIMAGYNLNKRRNRNSSHHMFFPYNEHGMLQFPIDYKSSLIDYKMLQNTTDSELKKIAPLFSF